MTRGSDRVRHAIDHADYTPVADGLAAIACWSIAEGGTTRRVVKLYAGEREIEVYISPTGRSVRVWLDGSEVKP